MANTQELENAKNKVLAFVENTFKGQEKEQLNKDLLEIFADEKELKNNLWELESFTEWWSSKCFVLCVKLILAKLATSKNVGKDTYSAALQYEIECTEKYLDAISSDTYAEVDKLKAKVERIKAEKGNVKHFRISKEALNLS